ncbi:TPA: hypothetical protein ACHK3O_004002, partial [Escherichia coli]|uniref:hypothetical protein n=1 Tax=Shigella boydii TaxID=621 RepID=UPI001C0A70E8
KHRSPEEILIFSDDGGIIIFDLAQVLLMKDVTCARGILHYGNNYYLQITSDPLLAILFQ